MFRLLTLKNNLALHRHLVTRLTARSNVAAGMVYRSAHRSRVVDGVVVVDINLDDMAQGDIEFARSFTKPVSALDSSLFQAAMEPVGKTDTKLPLVEDAVPAAGPLPADSPSTVLDKDGKPIVHIEIDGWNQDFGDEEHTTDQEANIEGNESVKK